MRDLLKDERIRKEIVRLGNQENLLKIVLKTFESLLNILKAFNWLFEDKFLQIGWVSFIFSKEAITWEN